MHFLPSWTVALAQPHDRVAVSGCPFPRPPFVLEATIPRRRHMKYMLLIQQGDTPTPPSDEWERLSDD
jgi:hypothetical protein